MSETAKISYIPIFFRQSKELLRIRPGSIAKFSKTKIEVDEDSLFSYSLMFFKLDGDYYARLVIKNKDIETPITFDHAFNKLESNSDKGNFLSFCSFTNIFFDEKHKYILYFDNKEMTEVDCIKIINLWIKQTFQTT